MKFINFLLFLWVIFALLDPDPYFESGSMDPRAPLNPEPIRKRIRIHNTAFQF